ncbi:Queuosine biosynthesis QueD, PTPS-I [[Actinomadura] parvosata subsp. kistnae]|uniref:6-carboxy-5,6,7,8-tetrahydropterin synthase n=1 Tax=[Actinomadura] parvosata subsp. kistnae TaxID=1909395 RepID=A0A1V0A0F6_9ACTN|nr:6-carboxytetrahydropterin synthase [Nonomuraea sp. ATCC 55076]AQZ63659.1 6-pyruvoyl tetrahydrobiopterin synthase [Nonomuraea sp. ATCC 55076]SPL99453.1 Queuosine biosynthesis QueD, PTPS-I [Actinomadura parvosata subsp. kistnae]
MTHRIRVRHNFETAHRLPHLGGKCHSLHGHSWWAEVVVEAEELSADQTIVEFGPFKKELRAFIDAHLDHGAMLGADDPLAPLLAAHGSKVYLFGQAPYVRDLPHPTVEAVAVLLARASEAILDGRERAAGARVGRVRVTETHVNAAEYVPGDGRRDPSLRRAAS